jgi:hypothetical protein
MRSVLFRARAFRSSLTIQHIKGIFLPVNWCGNPAPRNNAFYFFTYIGQYSGKFAVNLADFCQKIKKIDVKSVDFHFKRRDFQKWIRTTIGDTYLANAINKIRESAQGEELRDQIYQTVERRLAELKKQLAYEEAYVEHE